MARHKKTPTETHGNGDLAAKSATLSRNASASVDHYVAKRIRRRRHKVARNVLITLASLIVLAGAAMAAYVYHINTQLTGGLSPDLSSALTSTEAGRPFYVLLLGIDKDEGRSEGPEYGSSDSAYRSDSIMLARVDPQEKKVTLVSIHRDTLVNLGSYGEQKINAAFAFGGPAYATQVISQFSGVSISHYAQIDMDGMAQAVDAVGGVTVNLPTPVKDPQYTGLDLPAGEQTIDGRTAALLSRARHAYDAYGDGDLYRAANQRAVIMAVMKKVLASDPVTMVNTINTMAGMIKTDMDVNTIASLAAQFRGMNVDTDVMAGMEPTTSQYKNDTWYEICQTSAWRKMMSRVDQGLPPYENDADDPARGVSAQDSGAAATGEAGTTKTGEGASASDAPTYSGSVLVLNASMTDGAAGKVATTLKNRGFTATADTAAARESTTKVIYNGNGARSSALGVAQTLGGGVMPQANDGSYRTDVPVIVILGGDSY